MERWRLKDTHFRGKIGNFVFDFFPFAPFAILERSKIVKFHTIQFSRLLCRIFKTDSPKQLILGENRYFFMRDRRSKDASGESVESQEAVIAIFLESRTFGSLDRRAETRTSAGISFHRVDAWTMTAICTRMKK